MRRIAQIVAACLAVSRAGAALITVTTNDNYSKIESAQAGDEVARARDKHERTLARIVQRDSDALGALREARLLEHEAEPVVVAIERERQLDVHAREAIEAREEVVRVAHGRRAMAAFSSRSSARRSR